MRDAISRLDMREKSIPQRITVSFFFFFFFKLSKKNIYLFFFFYGHGKFGVHGRFAIYWISRNNGPRCIGSPVYLTFDHGEAYQFGPLTGQGSSLQDSTNGSIVLGRCSQ